jgi:hypothetical protein
MIAAMHTTVVEIAGTIRADLRAEVELLIRFGLGRVADEVGGVEVHVKAGRPRLVWVLVAPPGTRHRGCKLASVAEHDWLRRRGLWPAGLPSVRYGWSRRRADLEREAARHRIEPTRVELPRDVMRGLAYAGVPHRARTAPGVRYLVTLKIPPDPAAVAAYPMTSVYRRTVPVELTSWQHNLVHVAAHEACHVRQFAGGLRRSEVEAERWGIEAAGRARAEGLLPELESRALTPPSREVR